MRTKQEIDQDYTNHAVQYGHKARVIQQLQVEADAHLARLVEINAEGVALQDEERKSAVKAAPEADAGLGEVSQPA